MFGKDKPCEACPTKDRYIAFLEAQLEQATKALLEQRSPGVLARIDPNRKPQPAPVLQPNPPGRWGARERSTVAEIIGPPDPIPDTSSRESIKD